MFVAKISKKSYLLDIANKSYGFTQSFSVSFMITNPANV